MEEYKILIEKAIKYINEDRFREAEDNLKAAMAYDISAPQTHNLYGILSEYKGDRVLAAKHYRAAYALDPTYKPAITNLERVTGGSYIVSKDALDCGNCEKDEEKNDGFYIKYDENNVGHIKKRYKSMK